MRGDRRWSYHCATLTARIVITLFWTTQSWEPSQWFRAPARLYAYWAYWVHWNDCLWSLGGTKHFVLCVFYFKMITCTFPIFHCVPHYQVEVWYALLGVKVAKFQKSCCWVSDRLPTYRCYESAWTWETERWKSRAARECHYVYPCQRFSTRNTLEDYNP
jgi:hypothetical protein